MRVGYAPAAPAWIMTSIVTTAGLNRPGVARAMNVANLATVMTPGTRGD
jgi:hypothetical protein